MGQVAQFNFGNMLEGLEQALPPAAEALVCQGRRVTWPDLRRRSNNLGREMLRAGAQAGNTVSCYMRNGNEYLETVAACFKAQLAPVNVNYRYQAKELQYIVDNSDSVVVVYSAEFRDRVMQIRPSLPKVRLWLEVGEAEPPAWAGAYEAVAENPAYGGAPLELTRKDDDLLFLYTGGTTGHPKGVMWEHKALWLSMSPKPTEPEDHDLQAHCRKIADRHPGQRQLPACPLMHGTGLFTSINTLLNGGCVVTMPSIRMDPVELWDTVSTERVTAIGIVGDAFGKPMLQALNDYPDRWDLSCLQHIISSGTMFSPAVKEALIECLPSVRLADRFGSSEGLGFGASMSGAGEKEKSARFVIGPHAQVFDDRHRRIEPGSGEIGFIATAVTIPLGYYKDPEKTARTFPVIDGVRYSMPGDYCRVEADGTIVLLGRGSGCINSAGEKIYAEEVEEELKKHANIDDALVFGIDDDKWGQAVTAVVQPTDPAAFAEDELRQFIRRVLAGYKVPKRIFPTDNMGRAANGKADYSHVREYALRQLGRSARAKSD